LQPRVRGYLHYQFPYENAGTPERQADFFCNAIGELRPNEMVMLDTEGASGLRDPADFTLRWYSVVEPRLRTLSWSYVPRDLRNSLTRAVTGRRIVKVPYYSGHSGVGTAPSWPYDVHQYTDRGPFPGSPHGPGDCNVTGWTTEGLLAHCRGAGTQPQLPTLRENDRDPGSDGPVRRLQRELNEVYL